MMTNRNEPEIKVYQFSKEEELEMIRQHLVQMGRAVTLDNARIVLGLWASEVPDECKLTMDELEQLWPATT